MFIAVSVRTGSQQAWLVIYKVLLAFSVLNSFCCGEGNPDELLKLEKTSMSDFAWVKTS